MLQNQTHTETEALKIAVIGSGNVATHVAKALSLHHTILAVWSPNPQHASRLARLLQTQSVTDISKLPAHADLYLTAVKDDALAEVARQVASLHTNGLFVHTAGSVPQTIWEGHVNRYGVFYPMQTFSKQKEMDLQEVPFFIEAKHADDAQLLTQIARTISHRVYPATSEQRKKLHLAAVFCCNFTNYLYTLAADLLHEDGLPFDAFLPLIRETSDKLHQLPPYEAQTGPALRNDRTVIEAHLQALADKPQLKAVYELLSAGIQQRHASSTD